MALVATEAASFVALRLHYVFENVAHLYKCLNATGLDLNGSNQRLAMLGDAVLKHVLLDDWYATGASKGRQTLP